MESRSGFFRGSIVFFNKAHNLELGGITLARPFFFLGVSCVSMVPFSEDGYFFFAPLWRFGVIHQLSTESIRSS